MHGTCPRTDFRTRLVTHLLCVLNVLPPLCNKPANILSKEDIVTSGNQYMYLPYHFNKEVQEMGLSKVDYINTLDNISDLGTKAVDATTLKTLAPAALGHDHRLIKKITDYITRRDDVRATSGK